MAKKKKEKTLEDVNREIKRLEAKLKDKAHGDQMSGGDTKTITELVTLYKQRVALGDYDIINDEEEFL